MKNFIDFIKKYKIHILSSLLFIFFFRSCINSGQIKKLEKVKTENTKKIDSLRYIISGQKDTINNIKEFSTLIDGAKAAYLVESYDKSQEIVDYLVGLCNNNDVCISCS